MPDQTGCTLRHAPVDGLRGVRGPRRHHGPDRRCAIAPSVLDAAPL